MKNILARSILISTLMLSHAAFGNGLVPTPIFKSAEIDPIVDYDSLSGLYNYRYSIGNPASNTGQIWQFKIDVSVNSYAKYLRDDGLFIPLGSQTMPFAAFRDIIYSVKSARQRDLIPIGQTVPTGWNGGVQVNGYAVFSSSDDAPNIVPGQSMGGFILQSYGVPTFRDAELIPQWMYVSEDHNADDAATLELAGATEQSLVLSVKTLGPSAVFEGSFEHWDQFQRDLTTAISMGWVADIVLRDKLAAQLTEARQLINQGDGTAAKVRLNNIIGLVQTAPMQNLRSSAASLILLNAQALIERTPDTPIPIEPKLTVTPKISKLPIGSTATIQALLVNTADNNRPLEGYSLRFMFEEGWAELPNDRLYTDADGIANFIYLGVAPATDKFVIRHVGEVRGLEDRGTIIWSGGPDLVVPMFIPPLLKTEGNRTFYVTETTQNNGSTTAAPSVTRYFISSSADYVTGQQVIGERQVPALAPGESSSMNNIAFTIPSNLPIGTYYLSACADSDYTQTELVEDNNCSYSVIEGSQSVTVPIELAPPNCEKAIPDVPLLWPPNHKLATISIRNVTSPANVPITISITGITQDEPVNGLGDGDTAPDGFGVGTSTAKVRAERSGLGNGRVYGISFKADNGYGGNCAGSVRVGVPHDRGKGSVPIDDGQLYDSTRP